MTKIQVVWFDQLKGIGEGLTDNGFIVFLNIKYVNDYNGFLTLKRGEIVTGLILEDYAINIKKGE